LHFLSLQLSLCYSDLVNSWYRSHEAKDWATNPKTQVDEEVARFLDGFMRGKQFLELKDFWNQCFDLELAQKRVAGTYGDICLRYYIMMELNIS
jgi:hypothetical protein